MAVEVMGVMAMVACVASHLLVIALVIVPMSGRRGDDD